MFLIRRRLSTASRAVRVRFAPSPTGDMHLGGLRTALYNYLFAKQRNGKFILRIEDTDRTRLVPGAQERLIDTLHWAGLVPDEGPGDLGGERGPYIQSERLHFYRDFAEKLESKGAAYKCFCSERRLDLLRKDANTRKQAFKYDNKCRNLTSKEKDELLAKGTPHVYRFKLKEGAVSYRDIIHGETTIDLSKVESDFVILKSDGFPTYHLANVVDDHLMDISHVLRGVEWQVSTPKHLQMFEALDVSPPSYAHLPLMMNEDGTKLSKRNKGFLCDHLRSRFVPEAVLSFLLLTGGGFGRATGEFHRLKELIAEFQIESMNTKSCRIDFMRLEDMNYQAIQVMVDELEGEAFELVKKHHPNLDREYFRRVFKENSDRVKVLGDLVEPHLNFLWARSSKGEPLSDEWTETLQALTRSLETLEPFDVEALVKHLSDFHKNHLKEQKTYKEFMTTLRRLLSGSMGPSVSEMMASLGRAETIERLLNHRG